MKKIFNILFAVAIGLSLMASCDTKQEDVIYKPGAEDGLYSFSTPTVAKHMFVGTNPYIINVYRATTAGAATLNLTSAQKDGKESVNVLDIPDQVSFADGQAVAELKIVANSTMQPKINYNITIAMDEADWSKGGAREVKYVAGLEFDWESQGKGSFFDQLAFMSAETPEGLGIQTVEFYKAKGYDYWKIVDPFANRKRIEDPNVWGPGSALKDFSKEWVFYLKDDGEHLAYDGKIYPGILYADLGEQILYEMPSNVGPNYVFMDDNISYIGALGVFLLNPAAEIDNTTSWFGQITVIVGEPGVDLVPLLL